MTMSHRMDGYSIRRGGVVADGVYAAAGLELLRLTSDDTAVVTSSGVSYTFERTGWRMLRHVRGQDVWFGLADEDGNLAPVAFTVPDPTALAGAAAGMGWQIEDRGLPWWWWMRPSAALLGA